MKYGGYMLKKNSSDEIAERLCEMMPKFNQKFRLKLDLINDIIKLDLGVPHIMTMKMISKCKMSPIISDIAKSLSISYPMMTYIIDRLESKKLLKRIRNIEDRRIVRVVLTKRGEEILNRFHISHKKRIKTFLETLNKSDRKTFIKSMNEMFDILEKYSNSENYV